MKPVVVITGASAGVGRAAARSFARQGADVALLARGERGLSATAHGVESLGAKSVMVPTDVADAAGVEEPIFQPEIAADAIVWAAQHPRREYWVGLVHGAGRHCEPSRPRGARPLSRTSRFRLPAGRPLGLS